MKAVADNIPKQAFCDYKKKYRWRLDPKMGPVLAVQSRVVFAMPEKLSQES